MLCCIWILDPMGVRNAGKNEARKGKGREGVDSTPSVRACNAQAECGEVYYCQG